MSLTSQEQHTQYAPSLPQRHRVTPSSRSALFTDATPFPFGSTLGSRVAPELSNHGQSTDNINGQ